jgi:hypothetical protein
MTEHNYQIKLSRLAAEGKLQPPPGLWRLDIEHDSWCGINSGRSCNCDPDIYLYPEEDHSAKKKL